MKEYKLIPFLDDELEQAIDLVRVDSAARVDDAKSQRDGRASDGRRS